MYVAQLIIQQLLLMSTYMYMYVHVHNSFRFVLTDLAGQCRCKVNIILGHFGESTESVTTTDVCCDVCQNREMEFAGASGHIRT